MDPHLFSLLDPDPGEERKKQKKCKENGKEMYFLNKNITKCGQTPLFITFELSKSISTLHTVICYKFS